MNEDMEAAVRKAWAALAPHATWRGWATRWNALDLLMLAEVVHALRPAAVVAAGGLGTGGLAWFLADCLDQNRRGTLLAGEKMGRERHRLMPTHRRIHWVPTDLLVDDLRTAERLTEKGDPVLVVAAPPSASAVQQLSGLATPGSYLVVHGDVALELTRFPPPNFLPDPTRDPAGLSACAWLLRVPA